MTKKNYCVICSFFSSHRYFEAQFLKEAREAKSLRDLKTVLRTMGCDVSRSSVRRHLKHVGLEIEQQRVFERVIDKTRDIAKKPFEFFVKAPEQPRKCQHIQTTQFFDLSSEKVWVKCSRCGKLLGSVDSEKAEKRAERDPRNSVIYEALTRRNKA